MLLISIIKTSTAHRSQLLLTLKAIIILRRLQILPSGRIQKLVNSRMSAVPTDICVEIAMATA